jgi:hypothetical protein
MNPGTQPQREKGCLYPVLHHFAHVLRLIEPTAEQWRCRLKPVTYQVIRAVLRRLGVFGSTSDFWNLPRWKIDQNRRRGCGLAGDEPWVRYRSKSRRGGGKARQPFLTQTCPRGHSR